MRPILEVRELETAFYPNKEKKTFVDKISFQVNEGEVLGIVGESGSGKSLTAMSIMGILGGGGKVTGGTVVFNSKNLLSKSEKELDKVRGNEMSMIFQDTLTGLNPVFTIGNQMIETMVTHLHLNKREAKERAHALLKKVGLPDPKDIMKRYPHTLSGGMRQRVMIAMALTCRPKLLIADEPTTALDVTIQAQIMELLKEFKEELAMSILLITHDLGVIAEMTDRVLVMYAGQIVEEAKTFDLFYEPLHPYTKALLNAIPRKDLKEDDKLIPISGVVPEDYYNLKGCRFANRCAYAVAECHKEQVLIEIKKDHFVRCHKAEIQTMGL
jgi:peptide/nickel transport system ATP-binding protein